MCELLRSQGVDCKIVDEAPVFDVSFANNKIDPTIHLKVPSDEFVHAHAALEAYYQTQLSSLDPDYYLFSFSDAELLDLVQHPDEWGALDYALAKQLLAATWEARNGGTGRGYTGGTAGRIVEDGASACPMDLFCVSAGYRFLSFRIFPGIRAGFL